QIARKLSRTINPEDFTIFLTNWYSQEIFGDIKTHTQFSELIKQRLQNDPKQLVKSLKMMGTGVQPSLWSKLETNNVLLLLLVGELDPKFVEINTKIQQKAKYSQLEIVRDTAHNIHFAKPLEFVSVVKNFFVTKS
ncbi:MAG: 2-succinyl-6-hydroxy-2,4-cyclohexadiene-1-carboxylate synthase, partial [Mastigocoleus sp. MO_167.B18]|nr:2-succinyl-6-hydroxy-2,4-cyclohexadiene-1-carboxylate synthase [Mastigocoleus sp. MO_167.B18]